MILLIIIFALYIIAGIILGLKNMLYICDNTTKNIYELDTDSLLNLSGSGFPVITTSFYDIGGIK